MLNDPRLFNYVLMLMDLGAAVRWGASGRWSDVWYWLSAFSITAAVTWGYRH